MRILIIEDDKNLCQIMRAGLQDAGIDSDFCHDGETGLELLLHEANVVLINVRKFILLFLGFQHGNIKSQHFSLRVC